MSDVTVNDEVQEEEHRARHVEEPEEESDVVRLVEEVLPLTGLHREGGRIGVVMPAHDPTTRVISR